MLYLEPIFSLWQGNVAPCFMTMGRSTRESFTLDTRTANEILTVMSEAEEDVYH